MNEKKNDKEIRLANIADFSIEHRKDEDGGKMIIEGYAAVYDDETLIGSEDFGFFERIEKGAFEGANMKDVPLKYNHSDAVPILARTRNKSLELKTDDKGLFIRAELLDTQDNIDMYKRIKAGLIDKMSFAFTVKSEGETWEKGKTPKRSIKQFDRIFDVSVVDTPAYENTSIYARSLELADAFKGTVETESSETRKDYGISNLIKQYRKGERT
jgi:HK97 family phage prohead protease